VTQIDDLEKIEKNGKKFYKVMAEGRTYRAWEQDGKGKPNKAFEQLDKGEFKKGEDVNLQYTENKVGEYTYKNLTAILKGTGTPATPQASPQPSKPYTKPNFEARDNYWKDKLAFDKSNSGRIGRQACINSAVEYYKVTSIMNGEEWELVKLLEIALTFEKFAKTGVI